jgi:hypothetical protein
MDVGNRPADLRSSRMMEAKSYDEPSDVDAEDGDVTVKGPDAVDVRLTPSAAEETSDRLLEGAFKARGQRHFDDESGDPA